MASRLFCPQSNSKQLKFLLTFNKSLHTSMPTAVAAAEAPINQESSDKSFREKLREAWDGPNFKYWFIGATGFFSWLSYYSLKAYKNKCISVEILPPLPNHTVIEREKDISDLIDIFKSQSSLFQYNKNKRKILISGPSSSGKTVLASQLVNAVQNLQSAKYKLPKSDVKVFLQADNEISFLTSLKAFAAKLEVGIADLDEVFDDSENNFYNAPFNEQCNALVECIKEKLKKHPGWIVVIDQVQSTTPKNVIDQINGMFLSEISEWNSGLMVVLSDSVKDIAVHKHQTFKISTGLNPQEGCQLLQQLVNIDEKYVENNSLLSLVEKVCGNPLAIVCVAILLKEKLSHKEINSVRNTIEELCQEIEQNIQKVLDKNHHMRAFTSTSSGHKLVTIETVVAMALKAIVDKDEYLKHGIQFLATLAPGSIAPQNLVARHLMSPFYKLHNLSKPSSILDFMSKQKRDLEAVKTNAEEFDPKGKAWSNKNLAHYMRKVEDAFQTMYTTVKDIYNLLYGELPPLPEKDDGLSMFRECQLLQSGTLEPGGVKSISMHPLVYNVARQHFLSTISKHELGHLEESRTRYENQSWYRRMVSGFSQQACLQQHRNEAGHNGSKNLTEDSARSILFRYNLGIDISNIFEDGFFKDKPEAFWFPTTVEQLRYLQDHVSRVVTSLCDQIHVSKDDLTGKSMKKSLMYHLEYILQNHPFELIGEANQLNSLMAMAGGYMDVYKDSKRSKMLLDHVLRLEKSSSHTNPLDIARTLTELAQYHNNRAEYEQARSLLEQASEIYDANRKKMGEYKRPVEYGKMLGVLGTVYGSLNMKVESKETIERALMLQQSIPPDTTDEDKSKKFGVEFASCLIDLGHAYVSLGLPLYGKKILDLALAAQKNLNGENHPEVVRATTVLAIAHLLQGHNEESKKLRREAGKIQASINKIPLY